MSWSLTSSIPRLFPLSARLEYPVRGCDGVVPETLGGIDLGTGREWRVLGWMSILVHNPRQTSKSSSWWLQRELLDAHLLPWFC